ncbi:hypothetical protein KA478_01015 [Patescibacteria group bacterium]|nr:hypothetical protein [Patescibacteria group bacterium]
MTDREHAVADKKLHENILEEILPSAFSGIDESASVNSQNIDKIDF